MSLPASRTEPGRWRLPGRWGHRLHLRIWLAMVAALVVMAALAGWLWRLDDERQRAERPGREIIVSNAEGEVLGQAPARAIRPAGNGVIEFEVPLRDGQTLYIQLPRGRHPNPPSRMVEGPMHPGGPASAGEPAVRRTPPPPAWRPSMPGFLAMLAVLAGVLALATYPVVRRLTQRLERVQQGVQRWGEGDLSVRLPVEGHDEVAFLARRFNEAAERVQGLLRSHKTLLANASHELRSPLARVRMALELMDTADPATAARQRAEVVRNITELDELVDEILLASRLDLAGGSALRLEAVDLTALAAEECARVQVTLEVLAQPALQGDVRLLRRLLRNLLENAVRHGRRPGESVDTEVTLTLDQVDALGQRWAVVTVDDPGPGVPPAERERVFEPFYRLAGASERQGGVGLGLALVRQIARAHGGEVGCESSPTGGARFVVRLPQTGPDSPK